MKSKTLLVPIILIVLALLLTACTDEDNAEASGVVTLSSIDCERDIDCFIEASKHCSPATWSNQWGLEYEITGWKDDKCNVYIEFVNGNCPYEQESLTTMLESWKNGEWSDDDYDVCDQTSQIVVEE